MSSSNTYKLVLKDITKEYPSNNSKNQPIVALENFSLNVTSGEIVCLLGKSGCGKSTLLHLIAGFEKPNAGTVFVNGKICEKPGSDRGIVFQQPSLLPWLTVENNIRIALQISGQRKTEKYLVDKMLDTMKLTEFRNHVPAELSGGMAQRTALGRALISKPEILLLDEPFVSLDEENREELQDELLTLCRENGLTCVFVTHDISEAVYVASRIVVLTSRPARISEEYTITHPDHPEPRDRDSPKLNEYRKEIRAALRKASTNS